VKEILAMKVKLGQARMTPRAAALLGGGSEKVGAQKNIVRKRTVVRKRGGSREKISVQDGGKSRQDIEEGCCTEKLRNEKNISRGRELTPWPHFDTNLRIKSESGRRKVRNI